MATREEVRADCITGIRASLELRDRALEKGLGHLSSDQKRAFYDAFEEGRIQEAAEIFAADQPSP